MNEMEGFPVASSTDPAERHRCPTCGHLDTVTALEARLDAEEAAPPVPAADSPWDGIEAQMRDELVGADSEQHAERLDEIATSAENNARDGWVTAIYPLDAAALRAGAEAIRRVEELERENERLREKLRARVAMVDEAP